MYHRAQDGTQADESTSHPYDRHSHKLCLMSPKGESKERRHHNNPGSWESTWQGSRCGVTLLYFLSHLHSLHTQGVRALSNWHENLNSGCDCGPYKCWYFTLSCISLGAFNTSILKRKYITPISPNEENFGHFFVLFCFLVFGFFFEKFGHSWGESRSIALPQHLPFLNNSQHCFRFHQQPQTCSSDTLG